MRTESSTDVKNRFGEIMDAALREPVIIQRSGRNAAVLMAYEEYEKLIAMVDDAWGKKALAAQKEGYIGTQASEALLERLLNAED